MGPQDRLGRALDKMNIKNNGGTDGSSNSAALRIEEIFGRKREHTFLISKSQSMQNKIEIEV